MFVEEVGVGSGKIRLSRFESGEMPNTWLPFTTANEAFICRGGINISLLRLTVAFVLCESSKMPLSPITFR